MSDPIVTVIALPTFTRNVRTLKKKYRNLLEDLQPIIDQLENGETPGDQIPDIGYPVFKVRIRNTDIQKEKVVDIGSFITLKPHPQFYF